MKIKPAKLRELRELAGHTGRSLAAASGVSQQRISELEAAALPVRPPTAKALADALRCELRDITDVLEASAR